MLNYLKPTVFLIDDEKAVRDSMRLLLKSTGIPLVSFDSAEEFLEQVNENTIGCLLLDLRLPGMDGLELLDKLRQRDLALPAILLTGHGDVPQAIRALRAGVVDFLEKPYKDKSLVEKLRRLLGLCEKWRNIQIERKRAAEKFDRLTPREREVLELLVAGKKNKVIAEDLGISRKTLDIHRAKVMLKTEARTVADLVRWYYMVYPSEIPIASGCLSGM